MLRPLQTASALLCVLAVCCSGESREGSHQQAQGHGGLEDSLALESRILELESLPFHEDWRELLFRGSPGTSRQPVEPALVSIRAHDDVSVEELVEHLAAIQWLSLERRRPILGVLQKPGKAEWEVKEVAVGLSVQPFQTTYRIPGHGLPHIYVYVDAETQTPMVEVESFEPGNGHYGTAIVRMKQEWPPSGPGWKLESYLTLNHLSYGGPYVSPDCPVWLHEDMTIGQLRTVIRAFEDHNVKLLGLQTFGVTEPFLPAAGD